jgi:hypothetical protein
LESETRDGADLPLGQAIAVEDAADVVELRCFDVSSSLGRSRCTSHSPSAPVVPGSASGLPVKQV